MNKHTRVTEMKTFFLNNLSDAKMSHSNIIFLHSLGYVQCKSSNAALAKSMDSSVRVCVYIYIFV